MTTRIDPALSRAQLIAVARTGKPARGIGRMRALATLQQRPSPDVGDFFLDILKDRKEAPRVRHMAAMGIYRLGGARARAMLRTAARTADESNAAPIAVALGRIGEADDMKVIERLSTIAPRHARNRAQFAALLLAYRHRLPDHRVRPPAKEGLQELGRRRARPITFRPARGKALDFAAKALSEAPLEAAPVMQGAVRIECEPNDFLWLWAKDAVASRLKGVEKEKGVLGLLLLKSRFDDTYSLSLVGLITPSRGKYWISLHRPETGEVMYFGAAEPDGSFELRARDWPGHAAIEVKARATLGGLEIETARSAVTAPPARVPQPEGGAKRSPRTRGRQGK